MRSTARNDVKRHTEDNSPKYRMVGEILSILRSFACAQDDVKFMRHPELDATHVALCDSVGSYYRHWCRAFTLAEVLITLGIIGVVAAMTMPSVVNNVEGKQLQSALKKGYSEISQAFELMKSDIGRDILPVDYPPGTFAKEYKEYFVKTLSSNYSGLVSKDLDIVDFNGLKTYKTYNKKNSLISNFFDDGQFVLPDGALILINDSGPMLLSIDVNGMNKGPNLYGRDLFTFEITNEGKLLPSGAVGTSSVFLCSKTSTSSMNGGGCTYYAITDPNYFKKRYYK